MPHKRQRVSLRPRRGGNGRRRHWTRRLHRWVGIGTLLFAVILSISGIALNHAPDLGLDERYVQTNWLLDWYGIEAPAPTASYQAGAHRVTQLGERLYFDQRELRIHPGALAGAVEVGEVYAVAAGNGVLLATAEGELIESIQVGAGPDAIERIGAQDNAVVLHMAGRWYRSDEQIVDFAPLDQPPTGEIQWSEPSPISTPDLAATLRQLYRGRGVTSERLLADFHSGRLFGRFGPWVMDAAGVALLILGISGLILFLRFRKK